MDTVAGVLDGSWHVEDHEFHHGTSLRGFGATRRPDHEMFGWKLGRNINVRRMTRSHTPYASSAWFGWISCTQTTNCWQKALGICLPWLLCCDPFAKTKASILNRSISSFLGEQLIWGGSLSRCSANSRNESLDSLTWSRVTNHQPVIDLNCAKDQALNLEHCATLVYSIILSFIDPPKDYLYKIRTNRFIQGCPVRGIEGWETVERMILYGLQVLQTLSWGLIRCTVDFSWFLLGTLGLGAWFCTY